MKNTPPILIAALVASAMTFGASAAVADGATIAVVGGKADDQFFAKVKKGIDEATGVVEAHGGSVKYLMLQTYDNIGGDAANLVRTAISQQASIIAVPNWVPDTQDEAIKAATAAGIPILLYNAGGWEKAEELGAINFIGNEEYPAGLAGGEYLGTHDSKHVLCVVTVPGAQNHEDRCKGVSDGITNHGGESTRLPLPATAFGDPTAVAEAIKAALLKDSTLDSVVVLSAGDADSAAVGITQAGLTPKVKLGSFDMNETGLQRIKDGTQCLRLTSSHGSKASWQSPSQTPM